MLDDCILQQTSPETITVMFLLLLKAQHREYETIWAGKKHKLAPGEVLITESQLSSLCNGLSRQNVRTSIKNLENMNFLTKHLTKSGYAGMLIKINNWNKYQGEPNQASNQALTKLQPSPNQALTTNNNNKHTENNKNIKNTTTVDGKDQKINFEYFQTTWNEKLSPRVELITDERKFKIKTRLKKFPDLVEKFATAVQIISDSDFASGRTGQWTATFDWLVVNDTNILKVLEGNYANKQPTKEPEVKWEDMFNERK